MIFRGLFGGRKDEVETSAIPVIRNVTIGRTVRLDPLAWRRLGSGLVFEMETDTLEIVAQGLIDLGDSFVHRFYTDDDIMLQMMSVDAEGQDASDFSLFRPRPSVFPSDGRARREWNDRLRAPTFTGPGLPVYTRMWTGDTEGLQDPVDVFENVYDDRSGRHARRIFQSCMLYSRDVSGHGDIEMLLAMAMEPEGGDLTHEMMVGIPLDVGEFEA